MSENGISIMTDLLPAGEAAEGAAVLVRETLKGAPSAATSLTSHLSRGQGKGIRARLLMAAAMDGEGKVPAGAIRAAAAIELFHLATLVHDDVIDDAPIRRGMPTLHSAYGAKRAVLCGDFILCQALSLIAPFHEEYKQHADLLPVITRALGLTCLGELREFDNNRNTGLDMLSYLRIIAGKTSALFYVSAYTGGLIGNCSRDEARVLARFGRSLGMVFQIVDDCKDFECSEAQAGKPIYKDIAGGVITLPLILAIAREPELRDVAELAFDSKDAAVNLTARVRQAGGPGMAREVAARYAAKGKDLLSRINPAKRGALCELIEKAMNAAAAF